MSTTSKKTGKPVAAEALKSEGFARKGDTWVREEQESFLVACFQKSNFGPTYYLGLGIYLKAVGEPGKETAKTIKEHRCHVRLRAEDLGHAAEWKKVLDLESDLTIEEREAEADALIRRDILPWFKMCSTKAGLRVAMVEGRLKRAFVHIKVRELIATE